MNLTKRRWRSSSLVLALALASCSAMIDKPLATVPHVDLDRYMGSWYVIASIPTFLEKNAYNAVESYALQADGTIATTFTFRAGSFDGEEKRYRPKGFVLDRQTNALWGMQFLWPIKADYRIIYLAADYGVTIVGREKRDYVWIMARQPSLADAEYARLLAFAGTQGYDTSKIRKVPQQWR